MSQPVNCFRTQQVLTSLNLLLGRYESVRSLYAEIIKQTKELSYPQFNRYLRGKTPIPHKKEQIFLKFLANNLDLVNDLILPYIEVDQNLIPLLIDLRGLLSYPERINLLVFHIFERELVPTGDYDAILTHPEAVPIAIAFSMMLRIPWMSVTFRPPNQPTSHIQTYPYLIDNELISQVYFTSKNVDIRGKKLLLISDYIRRGGFIDLLFKITEEHEAFIHFFFAILGIGTEWQRLARSLEGNLLVGYGVD